jgi:hypothetical protein
MDIARVFMNAEFVAVAKDHVHFLQVNKLSAGAIGDSGRGGSSVAGAHEDRKCFVQVSMNSRTTQQRWYLFFVLF